MTESLDTPTIPDAFNPAAAPARIDLNALENVLTLDSIISGARLPERTVRICTRGDLIGQLDDVEGRLEELVDDDGEPIVDDEALGDQSEVVKLTIRAFALRTEIAKHTIPLRVRAMGSSKWKVFVETWQDTKTGTFKDGMSDALIIAASISPVIPDQPSLDRFRDAFSHSQTNAVFQAAFVANTTSGLDIPKLPPFLAGQKHEGRS